MVRARGPGEVDLALERHPEVYAPAEDSWLLAGHLAGQPDLAGAWALDVGTGTGVQAITLAREDARVVAVDRNPHACRLARRNAAAHGVGTRVHVLRADLLQALRPAPRFRVVAFNAPYLPARPEDRVTGWVDDAVTGGPTGIEVARRFLPDLPALLAPGGRAYLVVSTRGDTDALQEAARQAGFGVAVVAEEAFFFERVQVWELTQG